MINVSAAELPVFEGLRFRQSSAWRGGERLLVEDLIAGTSCSDLQLLELVQAEVLLRTARGDSCDITEYFQRFPALREQLPVLFDLPETGTDPIKGFSAGNSSDSFRFSLSGENLPTPFVDTEATRDASPPGFTPSRSMPVNFGDYVLLDELARGGMGVVYRAYHVKLNRHVALKMILGGRLASETSVQRFYAEAKAAARLQHSGIVPIFDIGQHESQRFYSMAFIEGGSLLARIKKGPLPAVEAATLARAIAEAVQYAHEQGVIHRDLKPSNILLERDGEPKITDFGVAKMLDQDPGLTSTGDVIGTPSYMAPEQATGQIQDIGPHSDIYSLGTILYTMLTGHPPFHAATLLETLRQVRDVEPVAPRLLNPDIPRDLEVICLKCLQKNPRQRYHSSQDVADDLGRFLRGDMIHARPAGRLERTWRWCRKSPLATSLIAAGLALAVVVNVALNYRRQFATSEISRRAAEELATSQRYFSIVNEVRELIANPRPAWTWDAVERIQTAASLKTPSRDELTLRNLATLCEMQVDLREQKVLSPFEDAILRGVAFDPAGKRLAIGKHKGGTKLEVLIYDVSTFDVIQKFSEDAFGSTISRLFSGNKKFQEGVGSLAWSTDGRHLAAGTRLGRVWVWDTISPKTPSQSWQASDKECEAVAFSADGSRVVVTHQETRWLTIGSGEKPTGSFGDQSRFFDLHPDGDRVLFSHRHCLRIGSMNSGEVVSGWGANLPVTWGATHVACHPGGRMAAVATAGHGLKLIDLLLGEEIATLRDDDAHGHLGFGGIQFANQGSLLISVDEDLCVRVWDVANSKLLLVTAAFSGEDPRIAVSERSNQLAVIAGTQLHVYELRGRGPMATVAVQSSRVTAFDMSSDGKQVAVVSDHLLGIGDPNRAGGPAKLHEVARWNVSNGQAADRQLILSPFSQTKDRDELASVAFAPDDSVVFGSTADFGGYAWCGRRPLQWMEQPTLNAVKVDAEQFTIEGGTVNLVPGTQATDETVRRLEVSQQQSASMGVKLPSKVVDSWPGDEWVILVRLRVEQAPISGMMFAMEDTKTVGAAALEIPAFAVPRDGFFYLAMRSVTRGEIRESGEVTARMRVLPGNSRSIIDVDEVVAIPYRCPKGVTHNLAISSLTVARDGRRIAGILTEQTQLGVWQIPGLHLESLHDESKSLSAIAAGLTSIFCLDAKQDFMAAGLRRGSVLLGNPDRMDFMKDIGFSPSEPVQAIAISDDETRVAIGTPTGRIHWLDQNGRPCSEWTAHPQGITAIVHDSRDHLLITAGLDKTIRFWREDPRDEFTECLNLPIGTRPATKLRLARNGRLLGVQIRGERAVRVIDLDQCRTACDRMGISWTNATPD